MTQATASPAYSELLGSFTACTLDTEINYCKYTLLPTMDFSFPKALQMFRYSEEDLLRELFKNLEIQIHIQVIKKFASTLLENIQDINPKYAKMADQHFWDLL